MINFFVGLFCGRIKSTHSDFQGTHELLRTAQGQKNEAAQFLKIKDWRNAIRLLTQARSILTVILGKDNDLTTEIVDLLAEGYFQAGLPELAEALWEDSRSRRNRNHGTLPVIPTDNQGSIAC